MARIAISSKLADQLLVEVHHRCCICVEHRKVANIHHIDGNNSNNTYENLVGVCGECHADLHTKSTMRRNITVNQIRMYKEEWKNTCKNIEENLKLDTSFINQYYYINVHRLESLFFQLSNESMVANAPFKFKDAEEYYNTLWHNPKNSINWMDIIQLREFFSKCASFVLNNVPSINLSLLEFGAYKPEDLKGKLIHFSCQFLGKDIPDQAELVENKGLIEAPNGTLRREIENYAEWEIIETCMLLDNNYYFSDSAFIHFSEDAIWNGLGIVGSFRNGIGSNDGPMTRKQIIISPICIGVPSKTLKSSEVMAKGHDLKDYNIYL